MFKKIEQMKDLTLQHSERMANLSTSREMMVMWNSKFAVSNLHLCHHRQAEGREAEEDNERGIMKEVK